MPHCVNMDKMINWTCKHEATDHRSYLRQDEHWLVPINGNHLSQQTRMNMTMNQHHKHGVVKPKPNSHGKSRGCSINIFMITLVANCKGNSLVMVDSTHKLWNVLSSYMGFETPYNAHKTIWHHCDDTDRYLSPPFGNYFLLTLGLPVWHSGERYCYLCFCLYA